MIIEVGSQRYKEIFGARDFLTQPFQSRLPPHRLLVEALADPSKSITAIDTLLADANPNGVLHSAGLQDIHLGTQVLMHARVAASRVGGQLVLPGNGLSSNLADGLVDVMKNFKIPARASDADVQAFLIEASFAVGMKALGAIGPVGKIAAAVIGFAREIIQLIKQRRLIKEDDAERREALAYAKLPPLQEPDTQVDAWYVDQVLRPLMEGPSWTPIFSPRFDSDEWVGIERNGGYAFAPGKNIEGLDEFGRERQVFTASGGIGFIPGLDQIASVVQVAHDPDVLKRWAGGPWPIHPQMVTDVGKVLRQHRPARRGRLGMGYRRRREPGPLQAPYRRAARAMETLLRRRPPLPARQRQGLERQPRQRPRTLRSASVPRRQRDRLRHRSLALPPQDNGYSLLSAGVRGDELRGPGLGRQVLGCVMDPPAMDAYASGQACFTTIYEERIQKVLDEALRRQRYFLRHSLVSAYVRADFDAFRDVKIRDALISARKILLEHPDRMLVELADVAADEPGVPTGDGKLWKDQLRARGVKDKHPLMGGAGRLADRPPGTLVPPREPPPKVPIYEGPLPWGELAEQAPTSSLSPWHIAGLTAGGLLLGGGAFALARHLRKGQVRPHS
jgi:hypothetical protein